MSTEGSCQGISSGAASSGSTAKQRKRKWDQPDESLLSVGLAVPGVLPVSNIISLAGTLVPGPMRASDGSLANPLAASNANISSVIQAPVMQHQAATIVQKSSQTKIQDELIIAREIVINDAEPAVRFKLTKRQMQEEIQKCTGAVVITRGKYRPPNAVPDGEKPLYLHISAGAHLKETAERIIAVDRAAAMVEEMLKQVPQPVSTCVYLGFEADPSLNIATRIRGPNSMGEILLFFVGVGWVLYVQDQYINHIMNETGATVILRGRGSGNSSCALGEEGLQSLHLFLSSNDLKSLESARLLAENLLDTISKDCGATRVPTSKVYGAVPQPQKLLSGVHVSGAEQKLDLSSVVSYPSSVVAGAPASAFPVKTPGVTTDTCCGLVAQPVGLFHSGQSPPNGMIYPQSSLISSTSYGGYAGIYPQATPLQQVALALRQSSTATMGAELKPGDRTSCEKEKRSSQKRKFQELPAPSKASTASYQGSEIQKSTKSSSDARKFPNMPPPKELVDSPPEVIPSPLLCSMPSSNPPHRTLFPPPPSRGVPPPEKKALTMSPPPKSMCPPPPKFNSLACAVEDSERESIACSSKAGTVPDTLVKLMEYGEDDDDDSEETLEDSCRSDLMASSKPFWAV